MHMTVNYIHINKNNSIYIHSNCHHRINLQYSGGDFIASFNFIQYIKPDLNKYTG